MLHFCPIDPDGHIVASVHCCEQMGWPSMSMVSVHTPLVHSVDVFETMVQVAPNAPAATPGASGLGVDDPLVQAASARASAARIRMAGYSGCKAWALLDAHDGRCLDRPTA
jgi:hypothetical protein